MQEKTQILSSSPVDGRVTQKELARRLGMSQATVSRALGKSPLLPQETIALVLAEAEKIGYRPDPTLSSLIAYRSSKRQPGEGKSLAWLTHFKADPTLRSWGRYYGPLYEGAQIRANQLGYNLEVVSTTESGMTAKKILKILSYRNVEGLIFPPQPHPHMRLNVPLDDFSSIAVGYSLHSPYLDQVAHAHSRSMVVVYRKLISYGYRRIGLIFNPQSDGRTAGLWRAAYYLQQSQKGEVKIPVLEVTENDLQALKVWYKRWKPDAVIMHLGKTTEIIKCIADIGLSVPQDLGIALLSLPEGVEQYAGINEHVADLGALAVNTLVSKIRNHERGIPKLRTQHLLDGEWRDGTTLLHRAH